MKSDAQRDRKHPRPRLRAAACSVHFRSRRVPAGRLDADARTAARESVRAAADGARVAAVVLEPVVRRSRVAGSGQRIEPRPDASTQAIDMQALFDRPPRRTVAALVRPARRSHHSTAENPPAESNANEVVDAEVVECRGARRRRVLRDAARSRARRDPARPARSGKHRRALVLRQRGRSRRVPRRLPPRRAAEP